MSALARFGGRKLNSAGIINSSASYFLTQRRTVATRLFVGGLSFLTTEQGLSEAFSRYGQVVEADVVMDKVSGKSKGFGFVTFASDDDAHKALMEFNGKQFNGRRIYVDYAKADQRFRGNDGVVVKARGPPEPGEVLATTTETLKTD